MRYTILYYLRTLLMDVMSSIDFCSWKSSRNWLPKKLTYWNEEFFVQRRIRQTPSCNCNYEIYYFYSLKLHHPLSTHYALSLSGLQTTDVTLTGAWGHEGDSDSLWSQNSFSFWYLITLCSAHGAPLPIPAN